MDHGLLVARLVVAELRHLLQCLADPADIAVAEDAEASGEKWLFSAVTFHVLVLEKCDDGLGHRVGPRFIVGLRYLFVHMCPPFVLNTVPHELESTVVLNEGHHLVMSGHKVGAAMLGDQDRAAGVAQTCSLVPVPSFNQAV